MSCARSSARRDEAAARAGADWTTASHGRCGAHFAPARRVRVRARTKVAPTNRIGIAAVRTANVRFFAQKPDHARNA
ncbi:hypothetical protein WS62_11265 [Burkholderia sp. ABCPW 14]|nr:hypothetical protein WS62_11265 [Burkholderia sp. ABCPW 14]